MMTEERSSVVETMSELNRMVLDPPRFGWTAVGGVADVLPPHERARRKGTRQAFMKRIIADQQRKLQESAAAAAAAANPLSAPGPTQGTYASVPVTNTQQLKPPPPGIAAMPSEPSSISQQQQQQIQNAALSQQHNPPLDPDSKPSATNTEPLAILPPVKLPPSLIETRQKILDDILGTKSQALGISIAEEDPPSAASATASTAADNNINTDAAIEPQKKKSSKKAPPQSQKNLVLPIQVHALQDGVLDMYSYHRGREGLEARSAMTGELLCDVPHTDTNYKNDAPKATVSVLIEFPLEDEGEEKSDMDDGSKGYSATCKFKETVTWDLADPNTMTPQEFAMKTAQDFGLTFGQAMDLAFSIQQQLDSHAIHHCKHHTPTSLKDVNGNERQLSDFPPQFANRYGDLLEPEGEGLLISKKLLQQKIQRGPLPPNRKLLAGESTVSTNSSETPSRYRQSQDDKSASSEHLQPQVVDLKIDKKYFDEVTRRLKEASTLDIRNRCVGQGQQAGVLQKMKNHQCHACHKPANTVFSIPCGVKSHNTCTFHCEQRFPDIRYKEEPPTSSYCPMCCLCCTCARCKRKLEALALDFQEQHKKQGKVPLDQVTYPDILRYANEKSSKLVKALERAKKGRVAKAAKAAVKTDGTNKHKSTTTKSISRQRTIVPKAPLNHFPREILGLRDLEPGTADDYMKVYTADGAVPCDDIPPFPEKNESSASVLGNIEPSNEVVEDGNVDFCQTCKKAGNIICCDFCPRAFHKDCMPPEDDDESSTRWKCHICRTEDQVIPGDLVSVEKSVDLITAAFLKAGADVQDEKMDSGLKILSLIHAMLRRLMEYDFGWMFSVPVDAKAVEGYKDLIKKPMDLGTIGSRLVNGYYANRLMNGGTWDDVIALVLKDIELVWHNCYTYNFEGSSIFRMADILRKRAQYIAKASFESFLNDDVKNQVSEFLKHCEEERQILGASKNITDSGKFQAFLDARPKGFYKIKVKAMKSSLKPVAVLDPETNRLLRVFSSSKSACEAALIISSLGNQSEWQTLSDQVVKTIVKQSSADPSCLLFGYRWLPLEDLRNGNVLFPKFDSEMLEMRHQGQTTIFHSVEEALSSPAFPKNLSLNETRKLLVNLQNDGTWETIEGTSWRRVRSQRQIAADSSAVKTSDGDKMEVQEEDNKDVGILNAPLTSRDQIAIFEKAYLEKFTSIVKFDLIAGRRLLAFDTIESAYHDWLEACEASPSFPASEPKSLDNFKAYYVNGDRNVDGLFWKGIDEKSSTEDPMNSQNETTEKTPAEGSQVSEPPLASSSAMYDTIETSFDSVGGQKLVEDPTKTNPEEGTCTEVETAATAKKVEQKMIDQSTSNLDSATEEGTSPKEDPKVVPMDVTEESEKSRKGKRKRDKISDDEDLVAASPRRSTRSRGNDDPESLSPRRSTRKVANEDDAAMMASPRRSTRGKCT